MRREAEERARREEERRAKEREEQKRRESAALLIESVWRGHSARKKSGYDSKVAMEKKRRNVAATKIQVSRKTQVKFVPAFVVMCSLFLVVDSVCDSLIVGCKEDHHIDCKIPYRNSAWNN